MLIGDVQCIIKTLEVELEAILSIEEIMEITLNSTYNKRKYAEILLCYRWLLVKGDVFIEE